jgi:cytochrome c oxidase subunit III
VSAVEAPKDRLAPKGEMTGPLLGMVLFVASEAMFFAAFFGAYFTIRASQPTWPPKGTAHLKIEIAAVLTVILVSSSVVLQFGVRAMRGSGPRRANLLLMVTIAMGATFLALQLFDYSKLGFGVKDGVFGTLFYVMTGLHMAHVFGGVVFLGVVLTQSRAGMLTKSHHESLEAATLYWHFVDVVWICLFTVFYLLTPR